MIHVIRQLLRFLSLAIVELAVPHGDGEQVRREAAVISGQLPA
jgi:hypothetical protein